jgi:hypothetical protein
MRRIEPLTAQYRDGLFALYERIFGAAKAERFRRRFDWQFVRNPYLREGQVTNWVLTSDYEGRRSFGCVPDRRQGRARTTARCVDLRLEVDAPHRFGTEISALRASATDSAELLIGYGMPEHVARSYVNLKLDAPGRRILPRHVSRHTRVVRFRTPHDGRGSRGRAGSMVRRAANLPRFCRQVLRLSLRPHPTGRLADVAVRSEFDASFDRLWERSAARIQSPWSAPARI